MTEDEAIFDIEAAIAILASLTSPEKVAERLRKYADELDALAKPKARKDTILEL